MSNEKEPPQRRNVSIAWRSLRCEAWEFGSIRRKTILQQLNGYFEFGTLNGLMGPSGAGKTTLLNCLSGNTTGSAPTSMIGGEIFAGEVSTKSQSPLESSSCSSTMATPESMVAIFVEQHVHETIVGAMTVGHIFRYAYRFKNGFGDDRHQIDRFIEQTLDDLQLPLDILERSFERCSGGEQKRIAIGQELMSRRKRASYLFIDEPTTGLDSSAAFEVMNCLKRLSSRQGLTIVTSIHLPNNETLQLFDKLYVLAKGGVAIYSGPPNEIASYLTTRAATRIGDQLPIERLIRIACDGVTDSRVVQLANMTIGDEYAQVTASVQTLRSVPRGLPSRRKRFTFTDLCLQTFRQFEIHFFAKWRSLALVVPILAVYFAMLATVFNEEMFTASACFAPSTVNQSTCAQNIMVDILVRESVNYLTYVMLYTGLLMITKSVLHFSSFIKIFRTEHRNHWYSISVFYWSSFMVSLFEVIFFASLITTFVYFFPRQHVIDDYAINWNRLSHYALFICLLCFYMQSYGQLIGLVLVDHVELAIVVALIMQALFGLMNGIFVDLARTKNPLVLISSSALGIKYISYGLLHTVYMLDRCDWSAGEDSIIANLFGVELDGVPRYVTYVCANIAAIRILTIVIMYVKFQPFNYWWMEKFLQLLQSPALNLQNVDSNLISKIQSHQKPQQESLQNSNSASLNEKLGNMLMLALPNARRGSQISLLSLNQYDLNRPIIAWRNLTLYGGSSFLETGAVPSSSTTIEPTTENVDTRKPILRNLDGEFHLGTLNALMGTSGAGKTSLLKVLNGRCKTRLGDETKFYLSNYVKIETCFITQEVSGHLMSGLTAKQALVYAARLKNPRGAVDCEAVADEVLEELKLNDIAHTKVERCSGGERKRLALALELTSKTHMPNLICIDEPTSGLDSNSAEIVISCLRKLTHSHPLTIVASIHQPNTKILNMFDRLYVLARGGVCIYAGPPTDIHDFLSEIPEAESNDPKYALEDLIRISCSSYDHPLVQQMIDAQAKKRKQALETDVPEATCLVPDGVQKNRRRFSLRSSYILFGRYFAYFRGNLWKLWLFFAVNYFCYVVSFRLFFDQKMVNYDGCLSMEDDFNPACFRSPASIEKLYYIIENYKYNFFYAVFFFFFIILQFAIIFLLEMRLFMNEHHNGWYSSGAFYLMKSIFDCIPLFIIVAIYVYIGDWYEDIRPGIYFHFIYIFILGALAFQGMAHVFAIIAKDNINTMTIVTVTVYLMITLLSNFLLTYGRLHYIYQFLSNFSVTRPVFEAIILLQYGFGRCRPNEIQQMLYAMSLTDDDFYRCVIMLIGNIVFYHVIAIVLLIYRANPVENRRRRAARIQAYSECLKKPQPEFTSITLSNLSM